MKSFKVYSDPKEIFKQMFIDLNSAKKFIFLETYIYDNDEIGKKILDILIKKAKQGVKIKLLLDAWGGNAKKPFFEKLIKYGGEVRFFREIRYLIRFISKNNERNHRKLLIIDNKITYLGSMNMTVNSINYRELVVKINGDITKALAKSFYQSWEIYGDLTIKRIETIIHNEYEIINDIPSYIERATEKRLYKLISKAKKNILIETPYFLPSVKLINSLGRAVKRGVNVELLTPYRSDIFIVDFARNRNLGRIYKKGITIHYYTKKILHSKLLLIDDNFFMLGSSNLDYRSFIHNFEINLVGKNKELIKKLKEFYNQGLEDSRPFSYEQWRQRPSLGKILEFLFGIIREYL